MLIDHHLITIAKEVNGRIFYQIHISNGLRGMSNLETRVAWPVKGGTGGGGEGRRWEGMSRDLQEERAELGLTWQLNSPFWQVEDLVSRRSLPCLDKTNIFSPSMYCPSSLTLKFIGTNSQDDLIIVSITFWWIAEFLDFADIGCLF